MVIEVPTRQVQTGTQWVGDWSNSYYTLKRAQEASTVESMSNSISIDLNYVGKRDSEEVLFYTFFDNNVTFYRDNWVQSEGNRSNYYVAHYTDGFTTTKVGSASANTVVNGNAEGANYTCTYDLPSDYAGGDLTSVTARVTNPTNGSVSVFDYNTTVSEHDINTITNTFTHGGHLKNTNSYSRNVTIQISFYYTAVAGQKTFTFEIPFGTNATRIELNKDNPAEILSPNNGEVSIVNCYQSGSTDNSIQVTIIFKNNTGENITNVSFRVFYIEYYYINEYTNTYTINEHGIEAYKDCVVSGPLPSGITTVICSPTGEEESNTATITAYSNSILDTISSVKAQVQFKPVMSIYAGTGNISVMPSYSNLSITLPDNNLRIFEQVNNANNIYINAGYYYNEHTSTPTIESPITVTANYEHTTEGAVYSTANGSLSFTNQIAYVNVRTQPNVGTLDDYSATAYSIYYTIRGTEDDIGKHGRIAFNYSRLQPTYTTYANVRFTGPCANGAWANDVLVNYINFNGERYP